MTQAQKLKQQRLAAIGWYVQDEAKRSFYLPPGQPLMPGARVILTVGQN